MQSKAARAERVAQAMNGRTIAWLAGAAGCALSTAHSYVGGTVPPADIAIRVAAALGVDIGWYINGTVNRAASAATVDVPLVDHDFNNVGTVSYSRELIEGLNTDPDGVSCILAPGASMSPTVPENSEVIYAALKSEPVEGGVYLLSIRGKPVIRRVRRTMSGSWIAVCDNPAFHAEHKEIVPAEAFQGLVIWVSHRP